MSAPVIQVRNLSKRYRLGSIGLGSLVDDAKRLGRRCGLPIPPPDPSKEFLALDDVSFSVEEGEVLGIIGPNGAGKSTLLKILSRITEPTFGQATLRGRVASLLEVGTGFHGDMTGRENIYLNGALYGLSKKEIQKQLDSIVDFAQVQEFIDTPVKRYSSGMYVRLAFAVAAHLRPEILIVDEVLAVGDADFQKRCIGKMQDAAQSGRTVLFVSHQMQIVTRLCSRALLLKNGKVEAEGPSSQVVDSYLAANVASASIRASKRTDREGTGECRLEHIQVMGPTNERRTINLQTTLKSFRACSLSGYASITGKANGVRLFTVSTMWKNEKIPFRDGQVIEWELEGSKLCGGTYTFDFMLQLNPGAEPVDYLLDAVSLQLDDHDHWKTGRTQAPGLDKVFVDFKYLLPNVLETEAKPHE